MRMTFTPKTRPNAIVTCCTPNWLPLAACTLKSCVEQGAGDLADLYIVTTHHSAEDASNLNKFLDKHGITVRLIEGKLPQDILAKAPKRYSAATFLRLTLDLQLDPSYERVLYLDSDVLALGPLAHLFQYDFRGKPLGAVEDYLSFPDRHGRAARHPSSIGLETGSRYFNAGVLLFDWKLVLHHNLLAESIHFILNSYATGRKLKFNDQDALNIVFAGKWHAMPTIFNLISIVSDYFPERPVLRHFTMDHKPWQKVKGMGYAEYYRMYQTMLVGTPWDGLTKKGLTKIALLHAIGGYLRSHDSNSRARYQKHLLG
jgi:lipopolysaccharide biosynthesis glycosyltransferase